MISVHLIQNIRLSLANGVILIPGRGIAPKISSLIHWDIFGTILYEKPL